jgi:hypothetical protein
MSHKYDEPQFEQRLGQMFQQTEDWFKRNMQGGNLTRILPLVLGVILIVWLASGVYIVDPGHTGVVRTFGKETTVIPGLSSASMSSASSRCAALKSGRAPVNA